MYVFGSRWRGMPSLLYPLQLAMQSTDPLLHQPEMKNKNTTKNFEKVPSSSQINYKFIIWKLYDFVWKSNFLKWSSYSQYGTGFNRRIQAKTFLHLFTETRFNIKIVSLTIYRDNSGIECSSASLPKAPIQHSWSLNLSRSSSSSSSYSSSLTAPSILWYMDMSLSTLLQLTSYFAETLC